MGVQVLLSFPCAVIPMALFIYIVRRLDKYDPEPFWLLMFHFGWGGILAVSAASLINSQAMTFFVGEGISSANATPDKKLALMFVIAFLGPIVEELLKASVFGVSARLREFNNLTDGIVYGSAVGFGFGMVENLVYFIQNAATDNWILLVVNRTFFSAMMHAISSAVFASFLGYGRFKYGDIPWRFAVMGFVPAALLHMAWNYFIMSNITSFNVVGFAVVVAAFAGMCFAFARSMKYEHIYIRQELVDEARMGNIPEEYIDLPFRDHNSGEEYLVALICSQIAFERITNRQLRSPHQIERSNKILDTLRKKIKTLPPLRLT
jgi:RsiW-degrading membrane proteinase PrsW (M82 family)